MPLPTWHGGSGALAAWGEAAGLGLGLGLVWLLYSWEGRRGERGRCLKPDLAVGGWEGRTVVAPAVREKGDRN